MVSRRRPKRKARATARGRATSVSGIKSIVKSTLESTREKKHFQQVSQDRIIKSTGSNFEMVPKVAQGVATNQRIGNNILWKSYHVRMILKGGRVMEQPAVFRIIWYTARVNGTLMPTTTSVTSFLDQEAFIIHSDKLHKIGTGMQRSAQEDPPSGTGAFKVLNFGRKFNKGATMVFDDSSNTSLLTNHMRCYVCSTSVSTSLDYATSLDFMSTCYYTDA